MTKIRTTDAAKDLGIHPSHLLLHIAGLDSSLTFSDVWPEIDTAWIETIATTSGHRRPRSASSPPPPPSRSAHTSTLSRNAIHVLDKLSRQSKWGSVAVAFDALLNLTHIPKRDLEEVINELRKAGFLDRNGARRGPISLNPAKREDIKRLRSFAGNPEGAPWAN